MKPQNKDLIQISMKMAFVLIEYDRIIKRCCDLDVLKESVVAKVEGEGLKEVTRTCQTFTSSLKDLKRLLKCKKVTYIVLECTGVCLEPVFNMLGENFKILLVNAWHIINVPGRKTDESESQQICKLSLSGIS